MIRYVLTQQKSFKYFTIKGVPFINYGVDFFQDEFYFLSNFYYSKFTYEEKSYKTVEHAFQSYKSYPISEWVRCAETPLIAKKRGRKVKLRNNWDTLKVYYMYEFVKSKFTQNDTLKKLLLATEDMYLVEGNYWHDNEWGVCHCGRDPCRKASTEKLNKLGIILMDVRQWLKNIN